MPIEIYFVSNNPIDGRYWRNIILVAYSFLKLPNFIFNLPYDAI